MNETRETSDPTAPRDPVFEWMGRTATATAARSRPWPNLDQAVRRDRSRRRARDVTAGVLVVALASAAVLPFTPVRVEPLDRVAVALGLRADETPPHRRSPAGLIQPDVDPEHQDTYVTGAKLPAPGGTPVSDGAWLAAAAQRGQALVLADTSLEISSVSTIWARDDGTTVRAVVGFWGAGKTDRHRPAAWLTLAAPSGTPGSALELGQASRLLRPRDPVNHSVEPGLVAVVEPEIHAAYVAGLPSVSARGIRTTTWHELTRVSRGLWVGDLGREGALGYQEILNVEFKDRPVVWWLDQISDAAVDSSGLSPVDAFVRDSPLAAAATLGYGGTWSKHPITLTREVATGTAEVSFDVRIVGVRSPAGGWLVTGDVKMTAESVAREGYTTPEERLRLLPLRPAPATTAGDTPFVGLADLDSAWRLPWPYAFVWAPAGIVSVRSGIATAPVTDGLAVIKVVADPTEEASEAPVLVEGLDRNGDVIARTWVARPMA